MFRYVLFAVSAAGIAGAAQLASTSRKPSPVLPPPVAPAVKPGPHAISAAALVEAAKENTRIGAPVGALVQSVEVKVWDKVKAGDVLMRLDDRDLQAGLLTQRADVATAKANLVVARAERERVATRYDRWNALAGTKAVSVDDLANQKQDLLVSDARIVAAQAALDRAEAVVKQTETLVARLVVRAPIDATVLQVNTRPGEFAPSGEFSAASGSTSSTPIVIGDIDTLQLRCDIDEQIAPRMKPGLRATAYLKGDTTRPIPLTFVRIEPYVIPKQSLTGSSVERVDTRVLQVIYRFGTPADRTVYVGQQMDVYIEEQNPSAK